MKYTKRQIREAIAYWERKLYESERPSPTFEFYKNGDAAASMSDDDIDRLVELRRQLYEKESGTWASVGVSIPVEEPCSKAGVVESLDESPYTVIARLKGYIVGFLFTSREKYQFLMPGNVYIDEDCVDEKYRGMGIGTKMVEFAMKMCKADGVKQFTASVDIANAASEKTFLKNGFKPIQKEYVYS